MFGNPHLFLNIRSLSKDLETVRAWEHIILGSPLIPQYVSYRRGFQPFKSRQSEPGGPRTTPARTDCLIVLVQFGIPEGPQNSKSKLVPNLQKIDSRYAAGPVCYNYMNICLNAPFR